MEEFLANMKEGFLRQLNLSHAPQEDRKILPPQFMVELYNKYASNRSEVPQFDVIRSFTVQGTETTEVVITLLYIYDGFLSQRSW